MSALVEFLRARLDEDERAARSQIRAVLPPGFSGLTREGVAHLPGPVQARVLAEVEAKRQMIDDTWGGPDHQDMWEHHMRLLALPYRDHPDYQKEWAP